MAEFDLRNVLATWVICPAFSASVILDRQSLVEMQPAAATDGIDAGARSATPARRMEAAPSRLLLIEWFREGTLVPMSHPRWRRTPQPQRIPDFICVNQKALQPKTPSTPVSSPRARCGEQKI